MNQETSTCVNLALPTEGSTCADGLHFYCDDSQNKVGHEIFSVSQGCHFNSKTFYNS